MKFLSKLGQILAKGLQIAGFFAPIVEAVLPGTSQTVQVVSQDLAQVAQIVAQVEVIGQTIGAGGPQKLQMAAPLVAQVLLTSSMLAKHKVSNETLFRQGATKIADGMADVMNSLHDDIATENKA